MRKIKGFQHFSVSISQKAGILNQAYKKGRFFLKREEDSLTLGVGAVAGSYPAFNACAVKIAADSKQLIHTPWHRAFFPPTHTYNIHMTLFLLLSIYRVVHQSCHLQYSVHCLPN